MRIHPLLMFCIAQTLLLGSSQVAKSATSTGTSTNSASVSATCQTPTTATLSFGNFNPLLGTALNSTTTINIRCTNTTQITSIALSSGSGTVAARRMTSGLNTLNYQLYQDSARSIVWGTTGTGLMTGVTGAGLNTDVTLTVYGQILANQQTAKPGSYSDSITVTLTY